MLVLKSMPLESLAPLLLEGGNAHIPSAADAISD